MARPSRRRAAARAAAAGAAVKAGRAGVSAAAAGHRDAGVGSRPSCRRLRKKRAGLQVLLRPGLLADVEIIVEKIPNAISHSRPAVFEKEGKTGGLRARPVGASRSAR